MKKFLLLLSVSACFLASCNRTTQQYDKAYFDFDSLINRQVVELVKSGAGISKQSVINGKKADTTFRTDSLRLANELEVFRQLDVINKPLYRNAYNVKDGEKDTKSNLLIRTYTTSLPSPVPFVKFYYQTYPYAIRKIESEYQEENALYAARRHLLLEFEDESDIMLLSGYQLKGVQKMILSDTVKFSVDVSFLPDNPDR